MIAQDYRSIEHIIMDGGSWDGSLQIVEKHQDHLARFVSEKDNGRSRRDQKGFSMASGDIYCWLNSDDIYFPVDDARRGANFF